MSHLSHHRSPKAQKERTSRPHTKSAGQHARKAVIEYGTSAGHDAEQIAASLEAAGTPLQRGAQDVLRLQKIWGFIEPGRDRAPAAKRRISTTNAPKEPKPPKVPKISKREAQREANERQRTQTLHYPTDCSFGPKKRTNGTAPVDGDDDAVEPPLEPRQLPLSLKSQPLAVNGTNQGPISVTAELMSVDFLVDLATSTLDAATHLKSMLLAYQDGMPTPDSQTGLPPTLADLSTARRKVREAASVMHDLAVDPVADTAPS